MGRDCEDLKRLKHPHLSIPGTGLHSTAKNFIWLFLPAVVWGRKILIQICKSELHQHTHRVNSQTSNTEIAELKNEPRHHNRASQSDDTLSFNQPSPTHHQCRLPYYLWQLSFLPSVVTIISAACDYPRAGLTPLHGHSIMFVSLNNLFSRCVVKNNLQFHHKCVFGQDRDIWIVNVSLFNITTSKQLWISSERTCFLFCIFWNCTQAERSLSAPVSLLLQSAVSKGCRGDSFSETKQPQLVTSGTIDHQFNTEGFWGH